MRKQTLFVKKRRYLLSACLAVFLSVILWYLPNNNCKVQAALLEYKDEAIYKVGNSYRDKNNNYLLKVGNTATFTATYATYGDRKSGIRWSIDNTRIVQFNDSLTNSYRRTIRGMQAGVTIVHGYISSSYMGDFHYDDNPFPIHVVEPLRSVTLEASTMTLAPGATASLDIKTMEPDSLYSLFVTSYSFSSSNPSVATIDNAGHINALNNGTTTLSFTTTDGVSASCLLTVSDGTYQPSTGNNSNGNKTVTKTSSGLSINKKNITLKSGKKTTLVTRFNEKKVTPDFKLTNGDKNSITISKKGVIKAKQSGTVTVKVTYRNKTKKCKVKVIPSDISFKKATANRNKITLRWKKASDISGYKIYRYDAQSGTYRQIKKLKAKKNQLILKNQNSGSYQFKISSYKKKKGKTYESELSSAVSVQVN